MNEENQPKLTPGIVQDFRPPGVCDECLTNLAAHVDFDTGEAGIYCQHTETLVMELQVGIYLCRRPVRPDELERACAMFSAAVAHVTENFH